MISAYCFRDVQKVPYNLYLVLILAVYSVLFTMACSAQTDEDAQGVIPDSTSQLIVVTTDTWNSTNASLQRFERIAGAWHPVSDLYPAVVGRSGLGWGTGLHPAQGDGPVKREGDGRAPAGVFRLTATFGYSDSLKTGLPYIYSTSDVECVDDSESVHYNRVLDRTTVEPDWQSHEEMRRRDELYEVGIIVAHNDGAVPGGGSCIFLHIWRAADSTTSGCTAMSAGLVNGIAEWLQADKMPILVQLPQSEYERLRSEWGLP